MPIRESRRLVGDRDASAQTISLLVAAAIFMAAVSAVLLASQDGVRDHAAADSAKHDVQAGSLADVLLGSPGIGWSAGPDQVVRLGLGAINGSGSLEPSSILALKGAMDSTAANSKVDYADAQRSLGIDPAGPQEFHIRMYPVGMDTVYDASLAGIRVGYVADFVALPDVTLPAGTLAAHYVGAANAKLDQSMKLAPSTALERAAIDDLGLDFDDRVHVSSSPASPNVVLERHGMPALDVVDAGTEPGFQGDVYPDIKSYLDVLPGRLPQYDILFIGSGVDHSSLTANAVKDGVRDWVLAGGVLVVLGSDGQSYQWLQPLFHAGVATVNGAAMAPDVSHPILKEPNELAWTSYDSHGRGWDIQDQGNGAHYDDFSHVIVQDGEDLMALSKDGAFGSGRILLTTYMPREIASTLGPNEAMGFVENIVLFADRTNLYLEYGPAAPLGEPVSIAVRQSWLWDEALGQVPVRIEIQTWS